MNAYKTTIKLLVSNGYILKRRGGNHDIFFNPRSKITILMRMICVIFLKKQALS